MKKIIKKLQVMLIGLVFLISLSGCTKLTADYNIYEDGQYEYRIEFLAPASIMELPDINNEMILTALMETMSLDPNIKFNEITKNINNTEYSGFYIERSKNHPIENDSVHIEVNHFKKELVFTLDNADFQDYFLNVEPVDEDKIDYANSIEIKLNFKMPGKILSASGGVINEETNTLEFDLFDQSMRQIIIRCQIPGLTINQILIITGGGLIIGLVCIIVFTKFKKKKSSNDNNIKTNDISKPIEIDEIIKSKDIIESDKESKPITKKQDSLHDVELSKPKLNKDLVIEFKDKVNLIKTETKIISNDNEIKLEVRKPRKKRLSQEINDLESTTSLSKKALKSKNKSF